MTTTETVDTVHLSTTKSVLADAFTRARTGIQPTRGPAPVPGRSDGALIEGHGDHATITTTDLETFTTIRLPIATTGTILVSHSEVTGLLKALTKGAKKNTADQAPVTLRADGETGAILDINGHSVPVNTYPVDDYPAVPNAATVATAAVDTARFTTETSRVSPAIADDDVVQNLTGMLVRVTGGTVTLAATNRYTLAGATLPATSALHADQSTLIAGHVMKALAKHATGDTMTIGMPTDVDTVPRGTPVYASFTTGDMTVVTRPLDGTFPNYEALFPDTTATVWFDRGQVTQAVGQAQAAAKVKGDSEQLVSIAIDNGISITPDVAQASSPTLPAATVGLQERATRLARGEYVANALAAFNDETRGIVKLSADPGKPLVFNNADDTCWWLVMPINTDGRR